MKTNEKRPIPGPPDPPHRAWDGRGACPTCRARCRVLPPVVKPDGDGRDELLAVAKRWLRLMGDAGAARCGCRPDEQYVCCHCEVVAAIEKAEACTCSELSGYEEPQFTGHERGCPKAPRKWSPAARAAIASGIAELELAVREQAERERASRQVVCVACGCADDCDNNMQEREWVSLPGDEVSVGWFHCDELVCAAKAEGRS